MAPTDYTDYEARLQEHGWKRGCACVLPISPLGYIGDCVSEGVKWTTILIILLIAFVVVAICAYVIYRGELYLCNLQL